MKRNMLFAVLLVAVALPLAAENSQPHSQFILEGDARDDYDPENPANECISITNTVYGLAYRKLDVKIEALKNRIQYKAYYDGRSCGGGSPRVTLYIDLDGDGNRDMLAHGHVKPPYTGCLPNTWQFEDLTDLVPRWEIVGLGFNSNIYQPWAALQAALSAVPSHEVILGFLVDDSGWFPPAAGKVYIDNLTIGNRSIENHEDTAGNSR
ncbi:MAG: hypothetical protein JJE51_10575 [Thermoanaerobaculia bacterium]|nr:hypothetical protein [Thermoanaerobaculia bacterium]